VREFYLGAEWDVFEVRDLWEHDGLLMSRHLIVVTGTKKTPQRTEMLPQSER
jgi:hypothetical protein